jgi:CheY-like chemotaxis protein
MVSVGSAKYRKRTTIRSRPTQVEALGRFEEICQKAIAPGHPPPGNHRVAGCCLALKKIGDGSFTLAHLAGDLVPSGSSATRTCFSGSTCRARGPTISFNQSTILRSRRTITPKGVAKNRTNKNSNPQLKERELKVKRLLCIDDSPDMLEALVDLLQWEFLIVGTLSSGSLALNEAANFKPDIILLDVDLGDVSGFRVAQQLRSSGCPAKIVFLSIHENPDFIQAAQDLGAAGYVFKSQITRDLAKTLHAAV